MYYIVLRRNFIYRKFKIIKYLCSYLPDFKILIFIHLLEKFNILLLEYFNILIDIFCLLAN